MESARVLVPDVPVNVTAAGAAETRAAVVNGSFTDRDNPYPGLHEFGEGDAAYFRGRDDEIAALLTLVRRGTLTTLCGASGLGKTSLLQAGLFVALRKLSHLPISIRLHFRPGSALGAQVREEIARVIADQQIEARPPKDASAETLWAYFHSVPFWTKANELLVPVLVFDQFEEIFTLGHGANEVPPFLEELADLVENRIPSAERERQQADPENRVLPGRFTQPKMKVLLALREDYLAQLEDLRELMPSLASSRLRLRAMTVDQARVAVRNERTERVVDADVAESIVAFVGALPAPMAGATPRLDDASVEPALLSLVCRELNEKRKKDHAEKIAAPGEGIGNRILDDFYARCTTELSAQARAFLEDRFLTADGFRTVVDLATCVRNGLDLRALNLLISRRLLRKDDRLPTAHFELVHDVIVDTVKRSKKQRLEEEALRAEVAAKEERRKREDAIREEERKSEAEEQKRALERQKSRNWKIGSVVLVALALAGMVIVPAVNTARMNQINEAEKVARAATAGRAERALVDEARLKLLAHDSAGSASLLELATTFAEEANEHPVDLAFLSTRAVATLGGVARVLDSEHGGIRRARYTPDGRRIVTLNVDGTFGLWDAAGSEREDNFAPPREEALDAGSARDGADLGETDGKQDPVDEPFTDVARTANDEIVALAPRALVVYVEGKVKASLRYKASEARLPERLEMGPGGRRFIAWGEGLPKAFAWKDGKLEETKVQALNDARPLAATPSGPGDTGDVRIPPLRFIDDDRVLRMTDRGVVIENLADPKDVPRLLSPAGRVSAIAVGNGHVAGAGLDNVVRIWPTAADATSPVQISPARLVRGMAFSKDDKQLAIVERDNAVTVWDTESKRVLDVPWWCDRTRSVRLDGASCGGPRALFAENGNLLLVAEGRREIAVRSKEHTLLASLREESGGGGFVAFGETTAVSIDAEHVARVWSLEKPAPREGVLSLGVPVRSVPSNLTFVRDAPNALAVAPHGERLAVAMRDGSVVAYSAALVPSKPLPRADVAPRALALSAEGRYLVGASTGDAVRLWNVDAGTMRTIDDSRPAGGQVAFSADGALFAATGATGKHCAWKASTRAAPHCVSTSQAGTAIAFAHAQPLVAVGDAEGRVIVWNALTGSVVVEMHGEKNAHADRIADLAFSPDDASLLSASRDRSARLWALADGSLRRTLLEDCAVRGIAFAPDGRLTTTAGDHTSIWPSNDAEKPLVVSVAGRVLGPAQVSGKIVLSSVSDGSVHVWSTDTRNLVSVVSFAPTSGESPLATLAVDGSILAMINGQALTVWPGESWFPSEGGRGEWRGAIRGIAGITRDPASKDHAGAARSSWFAAADEEGNAGVWSLSHGIGSHGHAAIEGMHGMTTLVDAAALATSRGWSSFGPPGEATARHESPWGRSPVLVNASADGHEVMTVDRALGVAIWSEDKSKPTRAFTLPVSGHRAPIRDVSFSHDGTRMATVGDDGLLIEWSTSTFEPSAPISVSTSPLRTVAYPEGDVLGPIMVTGDKTIALVAKGAVTELAGNDGAPGAAPDDAAAISAEGTYAAYPLDGALSFYDVLGKSTRTAPAPLGPSARVVFASTGTRFVAYAPTSRALVVGRADAPQSQVALEIGRAGVTNASLSANGDDVLATYDDGALRLWTTKPETDFMVLEKTGVDDAQLWGDDRVLEILSGEALLRNRNGHPSWRAPAYRILAMQRSAGVVAVGIDSKTLEIRGKVDFPERVASNEPIRSARFSRDGTMLAVVDWTGTVELWSRHDKRFVHRWIYESPIAAHDGGQSRILTADAAGVVRAWSVAHDPPEPSALPKIHTGRVRCGEIDGDGTRAITGGTDGKAIVWDLTKNTGVEISIPAEPMTSIGAVALSPAVSAFGGDSGLILVAKEGKAHPDVLRGHAHSIVALAFSPNGDFLASAAEDRTVRVWRVSDGVPLASFDTRGRVVRALAFVGDALVASGDGGYLETWDASLTNRSAFQLKDLLGAKRPRDKSQR